MATVKFKGELEVTLNGTELNVGDIAPVVTVVGQDLSDITIGGQNGKAQVIVVVPSLDTGLTPKEDVSGKRTFVTPISSRRKL